MAKKKLYAVIDLETTGGNVDVDRITEIAIVVFDGDKIVDQYESLVNPERTIPYNITQITGITQEMVEYAPKFYEVAKEVVERTQDCIFVAHNVRFDYDFLREEFGQLGYTFTRRRLCTVNMSKRAFPELSSYSLGNLIRFFQIPVERRHRAMDDALATVELLKYIFRSETEDDLIDRFVNLGIKESKLPPSITMESLHGLPEEPGVYYLLDKKGDIVYIGKSINIKKRVMEHFAQTTQKAKVLQESVFEIDYELTGSDLAAMLMESFEIKKHLPRVNKAQRILHLPYAIHRFEDEKGYHRLQLTRFSKKIKKEKEIVGEFGSLVSAKNHLQTITNEFQLCSKLTEMEKGTGPCFHYHIDQCLGACAGLEPVEEYNDRVEMAVSITPTGIEGSFAIVEKGRNSNEKSVIVVEDGTFCGIGYFEVNGDGLEMDDILNCIKQYPDTHEARRIITRYLSKKNNGKVIYF